MLSYTLCQKVKFINVHIFQTGYPEPENKTAGVINTIRSSLHLPIEETPPLEYQTSDDEVRSPSGMSKDKIIIFNYH